MLSEYHQKWAGKDDEAIRHHVLVKEMQVRQIFTAVGMPTSTSVPLRVGIMGCKEKRLALWQNELFGRLLGKPVKVTTFDITIEQLAGVPDAVQHDVTQPLPGGPFDLVYADVLVRFIAPERQFMVLQNAWDALAEGGMAIIAFSHDDYHPRPGYVPAPGTHRVDMNALQLELAKRGIPFMEVPVEVETVPPGREDKVIIDDLFLVFRR